MGKAGQKRGSTFVVAVALASLAGCGGGDVSSAPPPALQELAFDTLFTIGVPQGATWEAFGGIWDLDVSPSGYLALLDIDAAQVHVYDAAGAHVGSIVETGLEEGALEGPAGLAWSGPTDLLIWDPGASWISRFSVGDGGVEFVERWRGFAFGETGFCAVGDRTYLSYWADGLVVHEIGADEVVASFGAAPDIPGVDTLGPELQEIAIEELSPSGLSCGPSGVLDVSFFGSRVRFHDLDGTELWAHDFADFNPLAVYSSDGMGLGREFSPEGTQLLRSVVGWGEDMALVQHELRTQEFPPEGEVEVIESRLIRLSDGAEVDRSRDLPLVRATWGSRLYTVRDAPFAQVVAVEAR
jgi:hypothetical protein